MPKPRKQKRETKRHYASRLIRFYSREGYPHTQATAIGLRSAGVARPKKTKTRGSR